MYVHYVVLLEESKEKLKNVFFKLEKAAAKEVLQSNEGKIAYKFVKKMSTHYYIEHGKI